MKTFLPFAQIVVAIFLILFILLQQRGRALSSIFGETSGFYATRRGMEKKVFWATIIFGILFILLAIFNLLS
ncbi:preprotein translocase subunit SecG [Patescibacteria group bacterium]|nr:preprotein translocase subunit SecG [Patescibacteria group bacterium]